MSTICLCIIARDEEANLGACLRSAKSAVDQIVVVDTGSRDRTADIAREFGALVVTHEWNDDFSAARNAALPEVRADYVLVLDADERLARGAGRTLRRVTKKQKVDLGLMPLHNASTVDADDASVLSGDARRGDPILLARLFRKTDDLAWEGAVHENVDRWAMRPGRVIRTLTAPIIHLGAIPSVREALGKDRRNLELLERRCEQEPNHPLMRAHLAREYERAGDLRRASDEALRAWDTLVSIAKEQPGRYDPVLPLTLLAGYRLHEGRAEEALALVEKGRRLADPHPNLDFLEAEARRVLAQETSDEVRKDHWQRAAKAYRAALERAGQPFTAEVIAGATGDRSRLGLASVELARGNAAPARQALDRLEQASDISELLRAELDIVCDSPDRALKRLTPFVERNDPDAWYLAAEAAALLGSAEDVSRFAERGAASAAGEPLREPRRRAAIDALCEQFEREPIRVFAWPHWQGDTEIDLLLRDYGTLLVEHDDVQLFLRHDAALDGPYEEAVAAVERAYANHLPKPAVLDVVMLTDALEEERLRALAGPGDVALELESTAEPDRRSFVSRLGASTVSSPAALAGALRAPRSHRVG